MGKGDGKTFVFIHDPEYAWLPAIKTGDNGTKAQVRVPQYEEEQDIKCDGGDGASGWEDAEVPLKDYNKGLLPVQNVDGGGRLRPFADMVQLPFLHEVGYFRLFGILMNRTLLVSTLLFF